MAIVDRVTSLVGRGVVVVNLLIGMVTKAIIGRLVSSGEIVSFFFEQQYLLCPDVQFVPA